MKTTGIVRRLDDLGRIVLPIELRRNFELEEHDRVEIFVEDDKIILKKYEPNCLFCGSSKEVSEYKGKLICRKCIRDIKEL